VVLPAFAAAASGPTAGALRAENVNLEAQARSAVLDLYSLDSRLAAARSRLAALQAETARLRAERAAVKYQLVIAKLGERSSERQLASRVRQLYEQGDVSPIEVVFGSTSIADALTQLDNIDRVASLNDDVITQLRHARTRLLAASRSLAVRTARLREALDAAAASAASLAQTRSDRASYVTQLATRRNLNTAQIGRLDARARAAQALTQQLTGSPPAATVATPVAPDISMSPFGNSRTMTVTITGYALPGTTATGIPVGWGVAAVDPNVIPLGTHLWVPGYGEAVAADVGGAIVGTRVDLWFPTVAQAQTWGLRTLTIGLH
jgi:3D (Asp-Asp-Asp) domain-containing protein/peptidoglycan hydrolase CwlO-like protein